MCVAALYFLHAGHGTLIQIFIKPVHLLPLISEECEIIGSNLDIRFVLNSYESK
jgi:hypothetical protein